MAIIESLDGHEHLQVQVNNSDLPPRYPNGSCSEERLMLYEIMPNNRKIIELCGNETTTIKTNNKIMLRFYSTEINTKYSGFIIYVFAEKKFMEKMTMGIYFLFMAVAFIALIILFAHQMRTSKLKKSDIWNVLHILPMAARGRPLVKSGSDYAFQDDLKVRPLEPGTGSFRRAMRKTFLDHDADWRIIQPVRNAEDELCHLEDSTGQEDGHKPQQEIRYRHPQPVTDDDDDDDELPDILLADDKRTKGAMLHIIGAKVKQEEIEEIINKLAPSKQLYYRFLLEERQHEQHLPPDFSVKPIYVADGIISGSAQAEIIKALKQKKKKDKEEDEDEAPWLRSRDLAQKIMSSHRCSYEKKQALNCPCIQGTTKQRYSSNTSLPAESSTQELAHAFSVDIRCISDERSLRPYWADPARNLLEEPPPPSTPLLPPVKQSSEKAKPHASPVQKKGRKKTTVAQKPVSPAKKTYIVPSKMKPVVSPAKSKPVQTLPAVKTNRVLPKPSAAVRTDLALKRPSPPVNVVGDKAKASRAVKPATPAAKSQLATKSPSTDKTKAAAKGLLSTQEPPNTDTSQNCAELLTSPQSSPTSGSHWPHLAQDPVGVSLAVSPSQAYGAIAALGDVLKEPAAIEVGESVSPLATCSQEDSPHLHETRASSHSRSHSPSSDRQAALGRMQITLEESSSLTYVSSGSSRFSPLGGTRELDQSLSSAGGVGHSAESSAT
ncbi:hypothetical protein C0Q70_07816 [Pomacea canaliculata]|uniref:CUB domain-containing protein n=2 Tax=Pomacea canaliculata TaxID=400727 RepID=A0A2T7PG28_POMCA|nr:hypothetical protein C0Q70_07816 [Pomacea canaliculata]